MRVVSVESSTLAAVGYDQDRKLLEIEFRSRAVYHYFDVPGGVHQALLSAPSKGSCFNRTIRGRFPYRLVSDRSGTQSATALRRVQE
jgi:hypothetical protein